MCIYLSFWYEDGNVLLLAWRQGEVLNALEDELVPYSSKVGRLIELDLVGDTTSTQLLVLSVLEVPPSLRLLHKLTDDGALAIGARIVVNGSPDLQVLVRISFLILGVPLPGDNVSSQRGEAELEDVGRRQYRDNVSNRSINDGYLLRRGPCKETTIGRVDTTPEVSLGFLEAWKRLVYRSSVKNSNTLGSAV